LCLSLEKMTKKITAILAETGPQSQRSRIFLDGCNSFSMENRVIAEKALQVGQELSSAEIVLLGRSDAYQRCLTAAFQLLGYRARSESEIRERLLKRGFETQEIERVILQLRHSGRLDDMAFARSWQEDRNTFRPRSQRVLKMELKRKGVEAEVINAVVADTDETANARRVAMSKARTIPVSDYQVFRRRLGAYLQRRGFEFTVINDAVKEAWQARTQDAPGYSQAENEICAED
jgi:regulatory protein